MDYDDARSISNLVRAEGQAAPMKCSFHAGFAMCKTPGVVALVLALALFIGPRAKAQDIANGQRQDSASEEMSNSVALSGSPSSSPAPESSRGVTRYDTEFDGDRSLDVTTVVEQVFAGFARYTVRLQLASGAEQSLAVIAPPGGLQPEMLDMTGDKIPNDVVLAPTLFPWPPTVLLNEGHDHFEVAISAASPGSLGSGKNRASKDRDVQIVAALPSSGLRSGHLATRGVLFFPQPQQRLLASVAQTVAPRLGCASRLGRSPPAFPTQS
jgi:hypothetical protein